MNNSSWDASMPGAGAQRVCAIAQLYFRMVNYGALTTLVVDALCNAFSEDGATITELSNYLGVSEDRVLNALEAIPFSLRVTSDELDNSTQSENGSLSTYNPHDRKVKKEESATVNLVSSYNNINSNNNSNVSRKRNKMEETRYYLNFKRLLPTAYAHISYLLLSLCQIPLPTTTTTTTTTSSLLPNKGTRAFLSNNVEFTSEVESQKLQQQQRVAPTLFTSSSPTSANIVNSDNVGKTITSPISATLCSQERKESSIIDEHPEESDIKQINTVINSERTSNRITNSFKNVKGEHVHDLVDLVNATFNISPVLRRKEAKCGVYCASCRSYFALEEFALTTCKCPMCNCDVLASILLEIKKEFDSKAMNNEPLVTPLPQVRAALTATHGIGMKAVQSGSVNIERTSKPSTTSIEQKSESSHTNNVVGASSSVNASKAARNTDTEKDNEQHNTIKTANRKENDLQTKTTSVTYALASDPFLVQQAFAFFYLYSIKFAYVSDARQIVNSEDILTELEYARRLNGRASIADQFRARHRNPHSIRVRVIDQVNEDNVLRRVNALKIAKRTQLPPWLRHQPILHSIDLNGVISSNDSYDRDELVTDMYNNEMSEQIKKEELLEVEKELKQTQTEKAKRTKYENKEEKPNSSLLSSPVQTKRQRLQHIARYIASEFYNNDYDLVASWTSPVHKTRL